MKCNLLIMLNMIVENDYCTGVLFQFYRGDFEIMDSHDLTVNVSTFHQLYAACEQILVLRFDKKCKRHLYCLILWSKLPICSWYCLLIRIVVTSTSLPSVTIAIRCCQFDNTSVFEMPRTAEKLWNDYILQVHI